MRPWKPNFFRRSFVQKTNFLCINNVVEIFLKDSAVSMRPPKPLPRSILDRGSPSFPTIISIFSANSKPYSKWLYPMNRALGGIV
jgi:hypothetical protein